MARTSRPDSIYRVSLHRNGGHLYAATHPYTLDARGKRKYSIIHWGTVTENLRFIPGKRYIEATEQTRSLLVFPEEWDISAAERIVRTDSGNAGETPLPFSPADEGKAYGSVWLLGRVSSRFGLREDLAEALGSAASADDILTLAYYPFLTGMSFLRFARWQAFTKTPSSRPLEAMVSETLATVSRPVFRRFMDLRKTRHEGERLCAVDSIVRHSSGSSVSDLRWGHKTERIHLQSTVEAVAYSLDKSVPVIYFSYPEAVTDIRGLGIFRPELEKVGLEQITVITDRGYESLQGAGPYLDKGPMVMCVDVKQPAVMERINAFGSFRSRPAGMRYDAASRRWYRQYRLAPLAGDGGASPDLRLNLFFNPERREAELAQIGAEIETQQKALKEIVAYGVVIPDKRTLRRDYYLFNTVYDPEKQTVISFSPDKSRILQTRAASGFYANITSGLDTGPLEAVSIYGLKYDQEKFLRQFRTLMEFPNHPPFTEGMILGIQLLQYVALLLNTWLRHTLSSASAASPYRSVMEMLDDFHTVPCIDAGNGACAPAPLSQAQKAALEILGL